MKARDHAEIIREEFGKQAATFAAAPEMQDEEALRLLLELTEASPLDSALDVACGPGFVTCAFGRVVEHAVGVDLTVPMLERARELAARSGTPRVSWCAAEAERLPFPGGTFTVVTSRYAFHHFECPEAALREMARVCARGGRICVADVIASADPAKAEAFHRMEVLRDPSHVRAHTLVELVELVAMLGLEISKSAAYRVQFDVDRLIAGSFPSGGDRGRDELRRILSASLEGDRLGLSLRRFGERLVASYPIAVLVLKPAT